MKPLSAPEAEYTAQLLPLRAHIGQRVINATLPSQS